MWAVGLFAGQNLVNTSYGFHPYKLDASGASTISRHYGCFLGGDGRLLAAQIVYSIWLGGEHPDFTVTTCIAVGLVHMYVDQFALPLPLPLPLLLQLACILCCIHCAAYGAQALLGISRTAVLSEHGQDVFHHVSVVSTICLWKAGLLYEWAGIICPILCRLGLVQYVHLLVRPQAGGLLPCQCC